MGLCFSKKVEASSPSSNPKPNQKKAEKAPPKVLEAAPPAEKKPVFVIAHNSSAVDAPDAKEKKRCETPTKKASREAEGHGVPLMVVEEFKPAAGIRTSSCTKEEVDAILIQCGRLSRSSSGKAPNESGAAGAHRRHSGSKRSYDFDSERKGEEEGDEWGERPASRPSPHRRTPRTPSRERSGSRERGSGGGGRRVSRSPGRRPEGTPASSSAAASERSKQPAKMVAVPAREKGRGVSPAAPATKSVRSASPRSRSPAMFNENVAPHARPLNQPQSLSRSSSRKAEQSPYRRNPMAELDDNTLRANHNTSNKIQKTREGDDGIRKTNQPQAQKTSDNNNQGIRSNCVRGREQQQKGYVAAEGAIASENVSSKATEKSSFDGQIPKTIIRTRSSRRSSRDLDHALGLNEEHFVNPNSYVSPLLLEDIQSYNQQHPNAAFSLPACVSKACSILEAVADLNSTSSENKNLAGDHSSTGGRHGRRGGSVSAKEPFLESEIVAEDDLMGPSLHRYVTAVRDYDVEPQESAGSNSVVVGQPWASPWEPNSADSTDRYWTSRSNNGDEAEGEETRPNSASHQSWQQQQTPKESETRGSRRSKSVAAASGNSSGGGHMAPATPGKNRREIHVRSQVHRSSRKLGSKSYSLPAAAEAAESL